MMRSIRSKITLTYLLISAVTILITGWVADYQIEQYQFSRVLSELDSHTATILSILHGEKEGPSAGARVSALLHEIGGSANIRITLIDRSGRVLFESQVPDSLLATLENHSTRPEIVQAERTGRGTESRFSTTLNTTLAYLVRRIDHPPRPSDPYPNLRYVRTAMSLTDIEAMQSRIRIIIIVSAAIALVIVLIVSVFVSRQISRPVEEMGRVVEEVKEGRYSAKVQIRSRDEIGRFSALLNGLIDRLRDNDTQLERLQKVRSQFLANVSHELRTPLFSLKGFLETLLDGGAEDPKVSRRFLEKAQVQANRLDQLLSDLIDISKIESGEMKPSLRFFPINDLLHAVQEEQLDQASSRKQTLTAEPHSGDVQVLGDRELLKLVLRNLVDNALKYCPEGAKVVLSARDNDADVVVAVSDDGPGIAVEHQDRIFERFYRVDANRSRELGGTGLGLAICKHIIEAHDSRIVVRSEPGKGAAFSFALKRSE